MKVNQVRNRIDDLPILCTRLVVNCQEILLRISMTDKKKVFLTSKFEGNNCINEASKSYFIFPGNKVEEFKILNMSSRYDW